MSRKMMVLFGMAAAGLVLAANLHASPTIGSVETWDSGDAGWVLDDRGNSGIGMANPADYLQLTFTGGGSPRDAVMYTADPDFTGNYYAMQADFTVLFSVKAAQVAPSSLGLYFHNANGNEWVYYLTPPTAGNTKAYSLSTSLSSLGNYGLWQNLTLNAGAIDLATWTSDFSSVDRFGIYVLENAGFGGIESYELDNLRLMVPEPEAIWLVFAALASLGVTFRGKVSETVRGLIKRS
jgi:hypothetical protein